MEAIPAATEEVRISRLYVHQLVAQPPRIALIQQLQNTLGAAHRRILRVTTGRERVQVMVGAT